MSAAPVAFLDLAAINARYSSEFESAFRRVLSRGQWILGPEVEAFEEEFAAYCGCARAVGVANGMEAIELSLRAWRIGAGDEVIVPANTFIATWLAITAVGATVVPIDPDEASHNIDAQRIASAITARTRVVIVVHLYGRPAPMDGVRELAQRHGLRVLEDAAQAHGAAWRGVKAGALADAAAFSFYPAKNLGALGDGGAITTNDAGFADELRKLRNYGSAQRYSHERMGRNSRLDEIQAAMLRVKLPQLDGDNRRRAANAVRYSTELRGLPLLQVPAFDPSHGQSAWHLYVVRHPRRDQVVQRLAELGIGTHVHYPCPPYRQRAYSGMAQLAHTLPVTERLCREVLSLPIGPTMTEAEVGRVIAAMRKVCSEYQPRVR